MWFNKKYIKNLKVKNQMQFYIKRIQAVLFYFYVRDNNPKVILWKYKKYKKILLKGHTNILSQQIRED